MLKLNQFKISVFKILQVKHLRLEIFLTFFKAFRVFQVHFLKKVFLKKKLCVATTNYNMMFILCYFKKTKLGFFLFYLVKQRPKFYHIKENGQWNFSVSRLYFFYLLAANRIVSSMDKKGQLLADILGFIGLYISWILIIPVSTKPA